MMLAGAAAAVDEVVFQVRVAQRHLGDAVDGGPSERRAAEIRVDEDAGGVQHAPELRLPAGLEPCEGAQDEVAGVGAGPDLLARPLERRSRGLERRRARLAHETLVSEQLVDGGQVAKPHGNPV